MRKSRLGQDKQERLIAYFVSGATASFSVVPAPYPSSLRRQGPSGLVLSSLPDGNTLDSCLRRNDIWGAGMTVFPHP